MPSMRVSRTLAMIFGAPASSMIANTTSIASATQPSAFRPQAVGSAASPPAASISSTAQGSGNGGAGSFLIHLGAGQLRDDVARGLGREALALGERGLARFVERLGGLGGLGGELLVSGADAFLGIARGGVLGLLRHSLAFGMRRIDLRETGVLGRVRL